MEEVQEKSCVWKKLKRESNCNILQKGHIPFHVESLFKGWTSEGWYTICGIFTGMLKCLVSWILGFCNEITSLITLVGPWCFTSYMECRIMQQWNSWGMEFFLSFFRKTIFAENSAVLQYLQEQYRYGFQCCKNM